METKIVVLAGIALCAMLLVSPALASDTDTLEIYGNANEDDTIDMRDLTYVKLIFFGKKPETELADAKYDGKINPLDFIQIKLIIVGKEKELTLVDSIDRIVTVRKPVERIIPLYNPTAQTIRSLGAEGKVVGVGSDIEQAETFFPELSKLPYVGDPGGSPDFEMIIVLEPDIVIPNSFQASIQPYEEKLEPAGITVFYLDSGMIGTYSEDVKKLGYILGEKDRTDEYIDWYQSYMDTITERVEGLSGDDKPRVYGCAIYMTEACLCTFGEDNIADGLMIEMAGGINIAGDLPGDWIWVDQEWVLEQNPSIIFRTLWHPTVGYDVDDPSEAKAARKDVMSSFDHTDAVEEGDVYILACELTSHGPFFLGLPYMAKWFHPGLFGDLDPKKIHQKYLTEFQGLDYDLDEHGVFVYHPKKHPDGK